MKSLRLIFCLFFVALSTSLFGQEFFSTGPASRLFSIGARIGVNSSNRTFPAKAFNQWNVNSWGSGFDIGCVVDLNIRDFFSIQPGIFFETRKNTYAYAHDYYNRQGETKDFTQLGYDRSANITIPLLYSQRFNLSNKLRWIVEAGPYLQFIVYDKNRKDKIQVLEPQPTPNSELIVNGAKAAETDFGFKIGTGFTFKYKYSIFVHYLAGCKDAWTFPMKGGHNKAWVFSIGYDL